MENESQFAEKKYPKNSFLEPGYLSLSLAGVELPDARQGSKNGGTFLSHFILSGSPMH